MDNTFQNIFNSYRPTLICTKDSLVIAGNGAATKKFHRLFEKEIIFDYMTALDIIRFEAAVNSRNSAPIEFPISSYHGYLWAKALPQKLGSRTLVIITLFRNEQDAIAAEELEPNIEQENMFDRFYDFIYEFSQIDFLKIEEIDSSSLFDIKAITNRLVEDLSLETETVDCDILFTQNKEMEDTFCMPSTMSLDNYIKIFVALMYIMNDITRSRCISVRLCRYGDMIDLRLTTDTKKYLSNINNFNAFIDSFPSNILRVTICEFIAGQTGSTLSVSSCLEKQNITISLLITPERIDDVDFKSRDQMEHYEKMYTNTLHKFAEL